MSSARHAGKKLAAGLIDYPSGAPAGGGGCVPIPVAHQHWQGHASFFILLTVSKVSVSRAAALSRVLHLQIKDLPKALLISGPLACTLFQENVSLLYGEFIQCRGLEV